MSQVYVSSSCLKKPNLLHDQLNIFLKNDILNVELSGNYNHLSLASIKKEIKKYKKKINFLLHNYFPPPKNPIVLNFISKDLEIFKKSKSIIKNAIDLSNDMGIKLYAFHPGYLSDVNINKDGDFIFNKKKNFDINDGIKIFKDRFNIFYDDLNLTKKKLCTIGLENLFPEPNGNINSIMCTYEEIEEIFCSDEIINKKVYLLIDLGHLAISSNLLKFDRIRFIEKVLKNFSDRILEVHISENDEKNDLHLGLTKSSWQLDAIKIFNKKKKKLIYTLESRDSSIADIKNNVHMIKSAID